MSNTLSWERLPDELGRWFARFERYRLLGPTRSIEAAWRSETGAAKGSKGKRPTRHWYAMAKACSWRERAEAWDATVFAESGRECVLEFMRTITTATRQANAGMLRNRPKTWSQLLQTLNFLAKVILIPYSDNLGAKH